MIAAAGQLATAVAVAEAARVAREIAIHEERRRLALSLHDSVGALLFAIGSGVHTLKNEPALSSDARARLARIETQATSAAEDLRTTLTSLAAAPAQLALGVAVQADCHAFEQRTGIGTHLAILDPLPRLDPARTRALVDAIREALLNVEKHSQAGSVAVTIHLTASGVGAAVADDGVGFPGGTPPPERRGLGLDAAAERLARLGGSFVAANNDDCGVTVRISLPIGTR
jgi:signal transduction histidine kinase